MAFDLTDGLRQEYLSLFSNSEVRSERKAIVTETARKIVANRGRYTAVSQTVGVPWFVIGIIHSLEASQRFDRHLHNGDPLTGKTVQVPAGRPDGNPPFTWETSAIDALKWEKFDRITDWTMPGIAFALEKFNGTGYRTKHPEVKSPYLWSFTTVYSRGKYIKDGIFSSLAVSQQCGGLALLRALLDLSPDIAGAVNFSATNTADDGELTRNFPRVDGPDGSEDPDQIPLAPVPVFPGQYVKDGDSGPSVREIQKRLRSLGISPGPVDGDFGERTEEAVRIFQARGADLSGEPLEIDGIVGPLTWTALFQMGGATSVPPDPAVAQPAAPQLAQLLIDLAGAEVGVRERPLGSNRGPRVDQYIRSVGLDPTDDHYPWCMCFVYWCFDQASRQLARPNSFPKTGSVLSAWRAVKGNPNFRVVLYEDAKRDPSLVPAGSVFLLKTGATTGHTGIVVGNFNGRLETIEGNTNDTGGREGIGVFRRTKRRVNDINLGFVSLP